MDSPYKILSNRSLVLVGGWAEEEVAVLFEKAKEKDGVSDLLVCRALLHLVELAKMKTELASTSKKSKKIRLSTLMGRKEAEFDKVMNEIAVIVGKSLIDLVLGYLRTGRFSL